MKLTTLRGLLVTSSIAAAAFAFAAEDNPIKVNGTLDLYYLRDFNEGPGDANLRFLDNKKNKFTLNTALAKVRFTPKNSAFSASLDFGVGKMQDNSNLNEPGGKDRYKNFQQAFVTYKGKSMTLDFGKFLSFVGHESLENAENSSYSLGLLNTFATPNYHFGVRAGTKSGDIDLKAAIVRGWNEVEDSNGQLSYGLQAAKSLADTTKVTVSFVGGAEGKNGQVGGIGFADGLKRDTYLYDAVITHKLDDTTDLALEGVYGNALGKNGNPSAKWTGVGGWLTKKLNPKTSATLRMETLNDAEGQRTGLAQNLFSVSLAATYGLSPNSSFRLELRADRSNKAVFAKESGPLTKNRNTLTGAYVVKF